MTLKNIIERGLELGLEAVEVYAVTSESNRISLHQGELDKYTLSEIFSISIRGLKDGKMGYVNGESLDDEVVEKLLQQLLINVNTLDQTEPEFMFEGGSTYVEVKGANKSFKNVPTKDKIDMLKKMEKDAFAVDSKIVMIPHCQYSEAVSKVQIVNSKGLNLERENAYVVAVLDTVGALNDQTTSGFAVSASADYEGLNTDEVVKEATESALSQLGAGSVNTGHYEVVLSRSTASDILQAFASVFTGDAALRNLTILTNKVGQKVMGDNINIIENPFDERALEKSPFDDEGVPCQKKHLIENGVFTGFVHNLKTANMFKVAPTGNGFKQGGQIRTGVTNLYLEEGSMSKDEIIATVSDGVYITDVSGLHAGLNPVSGDFNVQSSGFIIKDGKLDRPITLFVLSGNFYELMNNVTAIGNDIKPNYLGVAAPTLKIKSLAISGK